MDAIRELQFYAEISHVFACSAVVLALDLAALKEWAISAELQLSFRRHVPEPGPPLCA